MIELRLRLNIDKRHYICLWAERKVKKCADWAIRLPVICEFRHFFSSDKNGPSRYAKIQSQGEWRQKSLGSKAAQSTGSLEKNGSQTAEACEEVAPLSSEDCSCLSPAVPQGWLRQSQSPQQHLQSCGMPGWLMPQPHQQQPLAGRQRSLCLSPWWKADQLKSSSCFGAMPQPVFRFPGDEGGLS